MWRAARQRFGGGVEQGAISVIAALLAYLPVAHLHLADGFWSSITAIAVTQGRFHDSAQLGQRQFIGAAVGGGVGLCAAVLCGSALWVYAGAVFLSIYLCALINRRDSGQLAGITATIILLVPHTASAEQTALARLGEVALGAAMGLVVSWLAHFLHRKTEM
jgi:uncharacterized membrane protein YgaE (UPF0421/DUF939 family)